MSEKKKKNANPNAGAPQGNVIPMGKLDCAYEECNSRSKRMGFCNDHYEYFKFGLIRKDGTKPPDFAQKMKHYESYLERTGKKAA